MATGIDQGLSLTYNPAFPVFGINQPSQQFRDNFSVIKSAIENLQSKVITVAGTDISGGTGIFDSGNTAITLNLSFNPNPSFNGTGSLTLPGGDSTARPGIPANGMIRYNTTISNVEYYAGGTWNPIQTGGAFVAKAGDTMSTGPLVFSNGNQTQWTLAAVTAFAGVVGTEFHIGTSSNNDIVLYSNNTERLRVTAAGLVGLNNPTPSVALDIIATDAIKLPGGTTAQRPAGANGLIRYNSDLAILEAYFGGSWQPLSIGSFVQKAGDTMTGSLTHANNTFSNYNNTGATVTGSLGILSTTNRLILGTNTINDLMFYTNSLARVYITGGNAPVTAKGGSGSGATFKITTVGTSITAAVVSTGGTGYLNGDILTIAGGYGSSAATLTVTGVSGSSITTVSVTTPGVYTVFPNLAGLIGVGSKSFAPITNLDVEGSLGISFPAGTTAQRPLLPDVTTVRYNTDTFRLESFEASVWSALGSPTGAILPFAGSFAVAPQGWLICDGSSIARSDFPGLFNVIGTTYGAIDGSHFNVPDLRGRTIFGLDNMGTAGPAGRITSAGSGIDGTGLGNTGGSQFRATTSGTGTFANGSSGGVITMPPTIMMNYIIKI